jgi:hypothetical protein
MIMQHENTLQYMRESARDRRNLPDLGHAEGLRTVSMSNRRSRHRSAGSHFNCPMRS